MGPAEYSEAMAENEKAEAKGEGTPRKAVKVKSEFSSKVIIAVISSILI
jgi:hypothetical protein